MHSRYLCPLLCCIILSAALSHASVIPHIKLANVNYVTEYYSAPIAAQVLNWQATHNDYYIGGASPKAYSTSNKWVVYKTIVGMYSIGSALNYYRDLMLYAAANGYVFENIFVHMKQNYTARKPWEDMGKFDIFENANGVIADNGGTLTDKTAAAYTTGGVSFTTNLYIGYDLPFDQVNFTFSTPASALSGQWQYWNGSAWTALTLAGDGTSNFTVNGKVSFIPPANWAKKSVNGSWEKYFLRYAVSAVGTAPVISKIFGDDWLATGTFNSRGWAAGDPNIVNSGELAYNPAPPANATAKFRYQARATGYWATGYVFVNPAYVANGKRVWGEFNAQKTIEDMNASGYDGVMYDSLGGTLYLGISSPTVNQSQYSDLDEYTADTWDNESLATFSAIVDKIHSDIPGSFVGGNVGHKTYSQIADFSYFEYASPPALAGALSVADYSASGTAIRYDDYLPIRNPTGKVAIFMQQDVLNHRSGTAAGGAFWDRANRGPMAALSSHYIATNENTALHYYSEGGWRYDETDDIFVFSTATTNMTQDVAVDTSASVKNIYGADFSSFPSAGTRIIKIGDDNILSTYNKIDNQHLTTTDPVYYPIASGDLVKFVKPTTSSTVDRMGHYTWSTYPYIENIYRWANYFPAMFIDVGVPDAAGWNSGARGLWNSTDKVYRRDYTKAIMVYKWAQYNTTKAEFDTFTTYSLGGTYYPLRADGRTSAGISQIQLRNGEGVVLMKAPVSMDTVPPMAPRGLRMR